MAILMIGVAVVRTWSYCGGLDPVGTFHRGVSRTLSDCEVCWAVFEKTIGLETSV
jgi:hypothetical protein